MAQKDQTVVSQASQSHQVLTAFDLYALYGRRPHDDDKKHLDTITSLLQAYKSTKSKLSLNIKLKIVEGLGFDRRPEEYTPNYIRMYQRQKQAELSPDEIHILTTLRGIHQDLHKSNMELDFPFKIYVYFTDLQKKRCLKNKQRACRRAFTIVG